MLSISWLMYSTIMTHCEGNIKITNNHEAASCRIHCWYLFISFTTYTVTACHKINPSFSVNLLKDFGCVTSI
jgi:hypothetical protein